MRVLQETGPLPLSWSQVATALHFNGGANTAPVHLSDESARLADSLVLAPMSAGCPSTSKSRPTSLRARRSEPDQDADDPSDDTSVSILLGATDHRPRGRRRGSESAQPYSANDSRLLRDRGKRPIKPVGWFGEQPDVVWREHPGYNIVEVKGITGLNEREQLVWGSDRSCATDSFPKNRGTRPRRGCYGRPTGRPAVDGDLRIAQRAALVAGQHGAGPWRSATVLQ